MSYQVLIDKAKPCLQEATKLDAEGNHAQAFKNYMCGIDFLEAALKGGVVFAPYIFALMSLVAPKDSAERLKISLNGYVDRAGQLCKKFEIKVEAVKKIILKEDSTGHG